MSVIASLANIWFQSSALQFAISEIEVQEFTGLTAYGTQRFKDGYYSVTCDIAATSKAAIMGALSHYLDFIKADVEATFAHPNWRNRLAPEAGEVKILDLSIRQPKAPEARNGGTMNAARVREHSFSMLLTSPINPPGPYRFIDREYITYLTNSEAIEVAHIS